MRMALEKQSAIIIVLIAYSIDFSAEQDDGLQNMLVRHGVDKHVNVLVNLFNWYFYIDANGAVCGGPYSYAGGFNLYGKAIIWSSAGEPNMISIANDSNDSSIANDILPYFDSSF
jgi:hypothetical protein